MSKLKVFIRRNRIAAFFWIGAILILIGIGLSVYTDSAIKNLEEKLFSPFWKFERASLTPQQIWDLEGSYEWWRMRRIDTFDPVSLILIGIGLVVLTYSFLSAIQHAGRKEPLLSVSR
jgi:hypothetical protein